MEYLVKLVEHNENTTHFEGKAFRKELKNGGYEMIFSNEKYHFSWKIYKKGLIIQSDSDISVHLTLKERAQTKGHIDTEYGRIPITCQTSIYKIYENHIEVEYDLLQGSQSQNFHFTLTISEGEHHVH